MSTTEFATIIVHLAEDHSFTKTACGLPWMPEPQNPIRAPRKLCPECSRISTGYGHGANPERGDTDG